MCTVETASDCVKCKIMTIFNITKMIFLIMQLFNKIMTIIMKLYVFLFCMSQHVDCGRLAMYNSTVACDLYLNYFTEMTLAASSHEPVASAVTRA